LAGFISTALVLLVRGWGGLEAVDLWSYDLWLRGQPAPSQDERFLVVLVTDADLVRLKQDQVTLATLQTLLFRLAELRPRVVGFALDTAFTVPQGQTVASELMAANVPVVVGCAPSVSWEPFGTLPTLVTRTGVTQTASTYLPGDGRSGVVRRYPLGGIIPAGSTAACQPGHSLGLLVAANYLALQGITPRLEGQTLHLGRGQWRPLQAHSGPYQGRRVQGWQMLLRPDPIPLEEITLSQALHTLTADQVQGRVVLVGEQLEANGQPWLPTPKGQRQPQIRFHAQAVAQILDQAVSGRGGINYLSEPWESLWIGVWGLLGVALVGYGRRILWLGIGGTGVMVLVWVLSSATWLPLAAPLLVWGLVLSAAPWTAHRRPPCPVPPPLEGTTQPSIPRGNFADSGQQWEGVAVGEGGRYLLQRHLGGGGMGDVFLALDQHLRKPVAVKILTRLPTETVHGDQIIRRFQREITVTAQINSIHIVQVSDSGVIQNEVPFYVMEYLRGQSLGSLIRQEAPLPVSRTVAILTQVCAGLQVAHSHNIVHRDLKPDNIFVLPGALGEELVKILDFGIARVIQETEPTTQLTAVGSFLGTYRYASPEQCDGRARLADQRADIYSLGLIAYEMLTGTNPFGVGENSHRQQWLRCHVQMEPIPILNQPFGGHIPAGLAKVVMACLAKKPSERYPDAGSLAQALQDFTEVFQP